MRFKLISCALLIASLLTVSGTSLADGTGNVTREVKAPGAQRYTEHSIEVGIAEPFQALHISDSHIIKIDDRDFSRLSKRFNKRISASQACLYREIELMDAVHYVETHDDMLFIHSGDFLDMYSEAGLDFEATIFNRLKNVIACVGNHEFINVNGKASLDDDSRFSLYDAIQPSLPNDIGFASVIYKGVNFVALDNTNNNVTKEIVRKMKAEVKKGYPIVIICHIPFYIPETIQERLDQRADWAKGASASVVGAPREITDKYPGDDEKQTGAKYEQRATSTTLEFTEWLRSQDCIKAILCGHNHRTHVEQFSPSCVQYTVAGGFNGFGNIFTFK